VFLDFSKREEQRKQVEVELHEMQPELHFEQFVIEKFEGVPKYPSRHLHLP
jgi:hypothetical protein